MLFPTAFTKRDVFVMWKKNRKRKRKIRRIGRKKISKPELRMILIKRATKSEKILQSFLNRHGFVFEFQKILFGYIVDFYVFCKTGDLIIEVDGGVHNIPSVSLKDRIREMNLEKRGFRIIRLTNDEVEDGNFILDALSNYDCIQK